MNFNKRIYQDRLQAYREAMDAANKAVKEAEHFTLAAEIAVKDKNKSWEWVAHYRAEVDAAFRALVDAEKSMRRNDGQGPARRLLSGYDDGGR